MHCKHKPMPAIQIQSVDDKAPVHKCRAVGTAGVPPVNFPMASYFEAVYDGCDSDDGDILVYYLKR